MTAKKRQKGKAKRPAAPQKKTRLAPAILLYVLLYAVCVVLGVGSALPEKRTLTVGSPSPETIVATKTIVDESTTQNQQQAAMQKVSPIYKTDETADTENAAAITDEFAALDKVRNRSRQLYLHKGNSAQSISVRSINWSSVLTAEEREELIELAPAYVDLDEIYVICAMEGEELTKLRDALLEQVRTRMKGGMLTEDIAEMLSDVRSSFISGGQFSAAQADLAVHVAQNSIRANRTFDSEATEAARQEAAAAVEPVTYQKGQTIVRQGDLISEEQYELIRQLGLLGDDSSATARWIGELLIMGVLFAVFILYGLIADRTLVESFKDALSLSLITLLGVLAALACKLVDLRFCPVFLPVILAAAFLRRRTALFYGGFVSVLTALVMAPAQGFLFDEQVLRMLLAALLGSGAAVLALRRKEHRGEYVLAGGVAGAVNAIVYLSYGLLEVYSLHKCLVLVAFGLINGLAGGLVSVGMLPIWETIFSFTTPSKLLELANPGNELLRRLMVEAPGTYHHSVMTANLAEAAAEAVGADSLLARVGAYYHDIGKLFSPLMFAENQMHIENPHNKLAPRDSAQIILRHTKTGVALAEKHKLPVRIREIIAQHHGDSLVAYFYYEEKKRSGDAVRESDFRYSGPKPQTKEAGIVMMADTIEAALRANGTTDPVEIRSQIRKLVKGKQDDGQLEDCPLSQKEIKRIEEAFLYVYEGANHERIVYPDEEEK